LSFDINRLRRADRIVAVSAIAFFIFLFFFKWYGVTSNVSAFGGVNVTKSGWSVFTNSRWIWLLTIVVALGAVAIASGALNLRSPVQPGVLVAGLGALSTALILYRIVHHPTASASFGTYHVSAGIKIGIWLGLIAAAGVAYGGYLQMQAEGTSLADVRAQASDAMGNLSAAATSRSAHDVASDAPHEPPTPPPAAGPGTEAPPGTPPDR
jgi:hypothetical protein